MTQEIDIKNNVVKQVIAVDFGTANTYISTSPGDRIQVVGIDFDSGKKSGLSTAILYRQGHPPLIGEAAIQEFGDASDREKKQKNYQLRLQFKPDILQSALSRQAAIDFLSAILALADKQHLPFYPQQSLVLFGVPSAASEDYIQALKAIAEEAGFGSIAIRHEPKGALLFHIAHQEIPLGKALSGGLVVDFGGGTCDFSFLAQGEVKASWGDFNLGGRLFDDLFFQWFLAQNPAALRKMKTREKDDRFFVHSYLCREIKENFSNTMLRDPEAILRKKVGDFGSLENLSWPEFCKRARAYVISPFLKEYWQSIGVPLGRFANHSPIDLLDWFRETLCQGWQQGEVKKEAIHYVIITGGSSQWPFVSEIVSAELPHLNPKSAIIRSSKPFAAISEGLAALPALQKHFEDAKQQLEAEKDDFFAKEIAPLVEKEIQQFSQETAAKVMLILFAAAIKPILLAFREAGGTLHELQEKIKQAITEKSLEMEDLLKNEIAGFLLYIADKSQEKTIHWFAKHKIKVTNRAVNLKDLERVLLLGDKDLPIPNVFNDISNIISSIISLIIAAITTTLSVTLLTTGPLGWLMAALLSGAIAYFSLRFGLEQAKKIAADQKLSAFIFQNLLNDKKLTETEAKINEHIAEQILKALTGSKTALEGEIKAIIQAELDALQAMNGL